MTTREPYYIFDSVLKSSRFLLGWKVYRIDQLQLQIWLNKYFVYMVQNVAANKESAEQLRDPAAAIGKIKSK
jgi:hypothetical protein